MANSDTFKCVTCDLDLTDRKAAVEHLKVVHQIENPHGNRQMVMHLDGEKFFQTNYEWTFGEVKLMEFCYNERTAKTMMW
jgi:hypothetical protein